MTDRRERRVDGPGALDSHELTGPGGAARVTRHGAHVLSWLPPDDFGAGDVLFLSRESRLEPGRAIRGGIPVCFPWFGACRFAAGMPSHGFARTTTWSVAEEREASVRYELVDDEATRARWPHAFRATLDVGVDRENALRLTMTIENRDEAPFVVENALHTYFRVGDARRAAVTGLAGCTFTDTVVTPPAAGQVQDAAPIAFVAETDRVYERVPPHLVLDAPAHARRIELTSRGAASAIVWNPWIDKAARLPDLADDEWTEFVCVETANAWRDELTLAPGASHETELLLRVTGLDVSD